MTEQLNYSAAKELAAKLQTYNPEANIIVSDNPQRGASKELTFKITVWAEEPGKGAKFTVNNMTEYGLIMAAITVLQLFPLSPTTSLAEAFK